MASLSFGDIKMTLDPSSIKSALDRIQELSESLPAAMKELCRFLARRGVSIAKTNLGKVGISGDGRLGTSIRFEMEDGSSGKGYVIAGNPGDHGSDNEAYSGISYAVFIEFGFGGGTIRKSKKTGKINSVQGIAQDHIMAGKAGYKRAVNGKKTGVTPTGQTFNGWVYKNREDGKFYVSHGQPPKPFMYNTLLDLMDLAENDGGTILRMFIGNGG